MLALGGQAGRPGSHFGGGALVAAGYDGGQGGAGHGPRRPGAAQGLHVGWGGEQVTGAQAGQVFIDMSTQLPKTAQASAQAFAAHGAQFLDAPVHGSRAEAHSGGLWIMAGGDPAAWTAAEPVLAEIGATRHHMGPTGSGCIAKLCGNHLVSAILASLAESLAMAEKSGIVTSGAADGAPAVSAADVLDIVCGAVRARALP